MLPGTALFWGNGLLLLCSLCYLAWWILAFRPNNPWRGGRAAVLLVLAAGLGVAGAVLMLVDVRAMHETLYPQRYLLWGGMGGYVLLLLLTYFLLRRQVTTELLLIVGWSMLELAAVNALGGAGELGEVEAIALSAAICAAAVGSLVCYILYYRLGKKAGYVDGMLPLLTAAAVMVVLAVFLVR